MPVFILGMHRSGTSAIARLVNMLGVSLGRDDDLVKDRGDNPQGHWESESLYRFNESLLWRLGGCWCVPPQLPLGWWQTPLLQQAAPSARTTLGQVYEGATQWVWKDPRNCLTLPFWLTILDHSPVIVFIHRNPLEVHASLEKRNGLCREVAVELWEIYNHYALQYSAGLPWFALSYDQLLANPATTLESLAAFLLRHRVVSEIKLPSETEVSQFLDSDLRKSHFDSNSVFASQITTQQKSLFEVLQSFGEPSDRFEPPALPELPSTSVLSGLRQGVLPALAYWRAR